MKAITKSGLCLLIMIISISQSLALSVSGKNTRFFIDFQPEYTREDTFTITNKEGYASTYIIKADYEYGKDLSRYITITPNKIENVEDGQSATFKVKIALPETINTPGESSTVVSVEIDPTQGGFRAYPAIGIPYKVFVLYPYRFIKWSFIAPDMNIDEVKDFDVTVENLGEPKLTNVYADIDVISLETNSIVKSLKTNTLFLDPKEKKVASASFDSSGLKPGNYRAAPVIHWDSNTSTNADKNFGISKLDFRIGSKNVKVLNFTKLFEHDSINQMDMIIESAWNTRIDNIFAQVSIFDKETGAKLKEFKSLNSELNPWEQKTVAAYFDTNGLEVGDYKALVNLQYEGASTEAEGIITIGKDINAKTFEEMPGKFKLDLSGVFTPVNLLVMLLVVFLIINVVLIVSVMKKKKESLDPAVVQHVMELREKYNDEYIRDMMMKKGWQKEKIEDILKEASKNEKK